MRRPSRERQGTNSLSDTSSFEYRSNTRRNTSLSFMQRGGSPSPIRSIESPTRNLSDLSQSPVSRFHSDRLLGLSHSGSFGGNNAFMPSYKRERLPVLSFSDLMANDGSFRPSEKREDRLRYLMAEAQQNHLEGASIFYAEKVLALSSE